MKKLIILFLLTFATGVLFSQQPVPVKGRSFDPVNPQKDKMEYQGYTIMLMPAMPTPQSMGSYGFTISKDNKPVVHQLQNPLLVSPKGLQKKDDAYKVAQWMIREYKKTGYW